MGLLYGQECKGHKQEHAANYPGYIDPVGRFSYVVKVISICPIRQRTLYAARGSQYVGAESAINDYEGYQFEVSLKGCHNIQPPVVGKRLSCKKGTGQPPWNAEVFDIVTES